MLVELLIHSGVYPRGYPWPLPLVANRMTFSVMPRIKFMAPSPIAVSNTNSIVSIMFDPELVGELHTHLQWDDGSVP